MINPDQTNDKKKSTALVLGGHGFVGKKVVTALQKRGHHVLVASRTDGIDLIDYATTERYLRETKPDVIFNCAAHVGSLHYVTTYAADVVQDNVLMALNLYRAVAKVTPQTKIINPLSNCSYPGAATIQTESAWWNGEVHESVFSYGNSKKIIYIISKCYAQQYHIKSVNFLFPNTFGPDDYTDPNKTHALNGMIIRMVQAHQRGDQTFEIWGTGQPIREWGYIDDIVKLLMAGMNLPDNLLDPVNMAQNKGYTIKESASYIAAAIGFKGELVFNTNYQDGAPIKILDDKKFRQLFPDFTFFDHRDGIKKTVEYYQSVLI